MQEEIEKMSDEEVLNFILLLNTSMTEYKMLKYYQNSDLIYTQLKEAKEIFLKRLSKNNSEANAVEEFKNKVILTIKDYLSKYPFMQGRETVKDNIEYLINNTK